MEDTIQRKDYQAVYFGRRTPTSHYKIGTLCLKWAEHTKCIGITIHSILRFDYHIGDKCPKSRKGTY